jgi:hypothetical protein
MADKKKKKTDKKNPDKGTPQSHKQREEEKPEGFDFGGLPQRDLKKNLGCG